MVFEPVNVTNNIPPISFAEWFIQIYRKRAAEGKTALVWADKGTKISYADLLHDGVRIATGLKAMGAKSCDTIGFVSRNSPELYAFVIGCIFADIKIAPSIFELSANELRSNFALTKARYIFTQQEKTSVVEEALVDLNPRPEVLILDEKTLKEILDRGAHANLATFQTVPVDDPSTHIFNYAFSSGTTGKQKTATQTDYYFITSVLSSTTAFFKRRGLLLCASQLSWVSWFDIITRCALADRPWLFTTATDVDSILRFIHKYKPTTYMCPPSKVYAISSAVERYPGRWNISSVKDILIGGDRLGAKTHRKLSKELKINIYQEYGSTEIGYITCPDVDEHQPIYGSAGKVVIPIKLVNPDTEEEITERNAVGEIRAKRIVMSGYLGNPEATREAFDKQGWCKTGDLGYLDEDNNLYVLDRIKEMITYKGFKVSPSELEEIIRFLPGVFDVGVVGKNDDIVGNLITAFVVKKTGSKVTENDIKNFMAKEDLHDANQLRGGVIFVDELPMNSSGKLQRKKLANILNSTRVPKDPVL